MPILMLVLLRNYFFLWRVDNDAVSSIIIQLGARSTTVVNSGVFFWFLSHHTQLFFCFDLKGLFVRPQAMCGLISRGQ